MKIYKTITLKGGVATLATGAGFVILLVFTAFVLGFAIHITTVMFQDGWRFYSK